MIRLIGQVCFFAVIVGTSVAKGEVLGPYLGFVKETESGVEYSLIFNFGLEQWENKKRSENLFHQWYLSCTYPDSVTRQLTTWCSIETDTFWISGEETIVHKENLYTSNGTLKLISVDWERGVLDFSMMHENKTTTEVKIRMIIKDKFIYLNSFEAFAIARGVFSDSLSPIEFRIPQYTYSLDMPIKIRGLRSENDKKWDDLFSSLSNADQQAWTNFKGNDLKQCKLFSDRRDQTEDQIMQQTVPNWEQRKIEIEKGGDLTPAETKGLKEYFSEHLVECFAKSHISLEGQKKIVEILTDRME